MLTNLTVGLQKRSQKFVQVVEKNVLLTVRSPWQGQELSLYSSEGEFLKKISFSNAEPQTLALQGGKAYYLLTKILLSPETVGLSPDARSLGVALSNNKTP